MNQFLSKFTYKICESSLLKEENIKEKKKKKNSWNYFFHIFHFKLSKINT